MNQSKQTNMSKKEDISTHRYERTKRTAKCKMSDYYLLFMAITIVYGYTSIQFHVTGINGHKTKQNKYVCQTRST